MRARPFLFAITVLSSFSILAPRGGSGDCPFCVSSGPGGGSGPNVRWSASDNIAACPAGDSLVAGHPAKLRIGVEYFDNLCNPRTGVPPDSIWITYASGAGNVVVNDKGVKVFADDTTDACGFARISVPSLSGCGQVSVYLYVAGVFQGTQVITVRTTDGDGDGRTTSADFSSLCDINYDGLVNHGDISLVIAHDQHWRRNALHGTLVRRTNYSETDPDGSVNTIGGSRLSWSPSARFIAHSAFVDAGLGNDPSCKVFLVPSNPADGNARTQFTASPIWEHDYDPFWSPLNTEIVFDRADSVIIRKPVPWSGSSSEARERM